MSELVEKIPLIILGSSDSLSLFKTHHTKYMVELFSLPIFEWDFLVVDTPKGEDFILGFEFLNNSNSSIDWMQGLLTFNADHNNYYDASKSSSNDVSSAKSCAGLVDEVLKQIEDVGEDNSVSSLHLIFANMNPPPSSYHDLLEELWDKEEEPEEVETMMKVVPSAYNQYLDVFSKVKAGKVPHRACDYHIDLEGSLPPVRVIYSLSNQESDKLRAYISEILEKAFIWPSSSSTGAPVLFVKKKDGGLCLCVDYCKLNTVTRKNKYPFPCMTQVLTVFNSSSTYNIELGGAYKLVRVKEGDEKLTEFQAKYGSDRYLVFHLGSPSLLPLFKIL
ncbi:hypothetical protein O181_053100 [Austropuccinia psidii MF-1]|uniref:Reverse transcriptase domain-containing protein n=1 Tax=Austropuccinia psidii MF-1 TaxID=1389203 RepID=A0A9Q3HT87_9BASI|nr:hypothetical protein [Austropuccinia psidii MF-1]